MSMRKWESGKPKKRAHIEPQGLGKGGCAVVS